MRKNTWILTSRNLFLNFIAALGELSNCALSLESEDRSPNSTTTRHEIWTSHLIFLGCIAHTFKKKKVLN